MSKENFINEETTTAAIMQEMITTYSPGDLQVSLQNAIDYLVFSGSKQTDITSDYGDCRFLIRILDKVDQSRLTIHAKS